MEHKKRSITGLSFLILGVIVLVIGIIAVNNTDMSKYSTHSVKRETYSEEYSAEGIEDIRLSLNTNDYKIIFDESADRIKIDNDGVNKDSYTVKTEDGTFKYEPRDMSDINIGKFKFHFFNFNLDNLGDIHSAKDLGLLFENGDGDVTITIPARFYNEVKLSGSVGNVEFIGCECKELNISAGVGNVKLNNVKADECRLSAGVGNIDGTGISFEEFHLSAGVGNVDLAGFAGDTKISCGMGNVTLHIKNSSDNYSIKEDNADIHEGGSSVSDKHYDMKISSGVGDCDIYFE